jgi:Arginyl tRNA synthetase N terminal domain
MPSLADQLSADIQAAVATAFAQGLIEGNAPLNITLERPKNRDHGDYATSIALQLAKAAGKNPREIATILQGAIATIAGVSKVDIAGPGFINITLDRASQAELVRTILTNRYEYGRGIALAGVKINLEFIGANQPVHCIWATLDGLPLAMHLVVFLAQLVHKSLASFISTTVGDRWSSLDCQYKQQHSVNRFPKMDTKEITFRI